MPPTSSKAKKVTRLQTLWGHFFTHRILPFEKAAKPSADYRRQLRLGWVAGKLGLEELASFNDLTWEQLDQAIDALQKELPPELVTKRRRPDRQTAQRYGTEGRSHRRGRRGSNSASNLKPPTSRITGPPDAATLSLLATLRAKAGMDEQRFAAWLRARSSPTRGSTSLNTLGKVNAVVWGLKRMIRRASRTGSQPVQKGAQATSLCHEEVPVG